MSGGVGFWPAVVLATKVMDRYLLLFLIGVVLPIILALYILSKLF